MIPYGTIRPILPSAMLVLGDFPFRGVGDSFKLVMM